MEKGEIFTLLVKWGLLNSAVVGYLEREGEEEEEVLVTVWVNSTRGIGLAADVIH